MTGSHILVIEDEEDIAELIKYNLSREGFKISISLTGEEGLVKARSELPDLILLDLMLPGLDGLEVCKALKLEAKTRHIPVVMLTAKGEEADIVIGLEMGADDYIVKPFSPRVLLARLKAVLRRKSKAAIDERAPLRIEDMVIDSASHEVTIAGQRIPLTTTEFRLLRFLAQRPSWVFTRDQIVDSIHGDETIVTDRSIDVHVAGLRKKLGKYGQYIETVRGVGYRFNENTESE